MRNVYAVFYSHVWVLDVLKESLSLPDDAVVVELSTQSAFGWAVSANTSLLKLLTRGTALESIAKDTHGVQFICAPQTRQADSAIRSAAGLLGTCPGNADTVVVLVDVEHAQAMSSVIARADRYAVLWDVADAPTSALSDVAQLLAELGRLNADTWDGFRVYEHPDRRVADADERSRLFASIINANGPLVQPRSADPAMTPAASS